MVLHELLSKKGTKANKSEHRACDYPFSLSFPHCLQLLQLAVFQTKFKHAPKCSLQGPLPNKTANVQTPPAQVLRGCLVSPDTPQGSNACPRASFISCIKPIASVEHSTAPALFSYFEPTRVHIIINLSPKQCWDSL